ncbi:uncharacterized protein K460DRAFT_354811 [Cucurbitaria berberidis CBS 394.84]|uniref:Uncharacterized protein n=1 Tax=Cucurbitaria berberidis CBS 394.84 TaxID=1168544 RepID=A0A9P4GGD6_9PLEO|nr:uncharacterized protein K460DRAFT_354811 [Cucurbitaria berberidis CBS 394.84]KAF1844949.1 hypothetical protein K460DRAFT_354811 [Cucurbitaria berberidis CBS 394.84]
MPAGKNCCQRNQSSRLVRIRRQRTQEKLHGREARLSQDRLRGHSRDLAAPCPIPKPPVGRRRRLRKRPWISSTPAAVPLVTKLGPNFLFHLTVLPACSLQKDHGTLFGLEHGRLARTDNLTTTGHGGPDGATEGGVNRSLLNGAIVCAK